jgi:pimeloyl-ACP methyl ester carboxylesterase
MDGMTRSAQAATSSSVSTRTTVDTRNMALSELSINGPSTVNYLGQAQYQVLHNGEDVSAQAELWGYLPPDNWNPSVVNGMLTADIGRPGDVIVLRAQYVRPEGVRSAEKRVTILSDPNELVFTISRPQVAFEAPLGQNFQWSLAAAVDYEAVPNPSVTYTWTLDGETVKTGKSVSWPSIVGTPSERKLTVVADDGAGHTATRTVWVTMNAPNPGAAWKYYNVWRKKGYSFIDKNEDLYLPIPERIPNGLIVLTHGLGGSPFNDWLRILARAIDTRLTSDGKPLPNIAIFGWADDASPSESNATTLEKVATVLRLWRSASSTERKLLATSPVFADFAYDLLLIKPMAKDVGRRGLSEWLKEQITTGNVSPTAPIHLIGHSAGGFVMGECYLENRDLNIRRVTLLDTPFPEDRHESAGDPAVIERIVSSIFGRREFQSQRDNSTYYRYVDIGSDTDYSAAILGLDSLPAQWIDAHSNCHDWYKDTATEEVPTEGFNLSPFLTGGGQSLYRLATKPEATPNPTILFTGQTPISGFSTFGSVSNVAGNYFLYENGDAGIYTNIAFPPDADTLQVAFRYVTAGDDDALVISASDDPPLFIYSAPPEPESGLYTALVDVVSYAMTTQSLVIRLAAMGAQSSVVEVASVTLLTSEDADGDGLASTNEALLGTSPAKTDTDGDGLSDPDELNTYLTNPTNPDSDGDGIGDKDEVDSGTNPNNPESLLEITATGQTNGPVNLQWQAATGKTYRVMRSSDIGFASYDIVGSSITSLPPTQSFNEASPSTNRTGFYRVMTE